MKTSLSKLEYSRKWRLEHQERCDYLNARRYERHRQEIIRQNGEWDKANPRNHRVRTIVWSAIKAGEVEQCNTCSLCEDIGDIQAHHEDYSLPLEITWLCRSCHKKLHAGTLTRTS